MNKNHNEHNQHLGNLVSSCEVSSDFGAGEVAIAIAGGAIDSGGSEGSTGEASTG